MDCPVFASESGQREGELTPYKCPIIYCPPSEDRDHRSGGNFSYSICTKYIDDVNPNNKQFIKKTCLSDYLYCNLDCDSLREYGSSYFHTGNYNYTGYFATGCKDGDQTINQNNSRIFTEITTSNRQPIRPSVAITDIMNTQIPEAPVSSALASEIPVALMPCLLILLLTVSLIQKKF